MITAPDQIAAIVLLARGPHCIGPIDSEEKAFAMLTLERLRATGHVISNTPRGGHPTYMLTRQGWQEFAAISPVPVAL